MTHTTPPPAAVPPPDDTEWLMKVIMERDTALARADRLAAALRAAAPHADMDACCCVACCRVKAALREAGEAPTTGRPTPQERCPECRRLVGFCEHTNGGTP